MTGAEWNKVIEFVKSRLENQKINTTEAIHGAAIVGDIKLLRYLLQLGVDSNATLDTGSGTYMTPIGSAAEQGAVSWPEVMDLLMEGGCNINKLPGTQMVTPLCAAAGSRIEPSEKISWLLRHGATSSLEIESMNMRPLHIASKGGYVQVVDALLNAGAAVDAVATLTGRPTPLHLAADYGHAEVVSRLLMKGAGIDARTHTHKTPLHVAIIGIQGDVPKAIQTKSLEVTQILIDKNATIDARDNKGMTALHYAALNGLRDQAYALIKASPKTVNLECNGQTAYAMASLEGWKEVATDLAFFATEEDKASVAKALRRSKRKTYFRLGTSRAKLFG